MSTVRYKRSELPSLTEKWESELKALADKPDSDIDHSDIPSLTEDFW